MNLKHTPSNTLYLILYVISLQMKTMKFFALVYIVIKTISWLYGRYYLHSKISSVNSLDIL